MRLLIAIAALLLSATGSVAFQAEVEGWLVRDFAVNEKDLKMTACVAGRDFQGTRLSFVVTTEYKWAVGIANEAWKLQKDATTDIAAYVDKKFVASGKAWHLDNKAAFLPLDGLEPYRALQKGQQLDLQTPYGRLNFALIGSGKAMYAVLDCVRTLQPPQQKRPADQDALIVPQAEAIVILTNLLNAAGIQGYQLTTPKDGKNAASFKLADGTAGQLFAYRGLGTKGADDHAAYAIGRWSEICKGQYMSGKQSVPSVDGSVVRKVTTTCSGGEREFVTETTVLRRADGFLIDLTMIFPISQTAISNDRAAVENAALRVKDSR